jgi:hypothetical protein
MNTSRAAHALHSASGAPICTERQQLQRQLSCEACWRGHPAAVLQCRAQCVLYEFCLVAGGWLAVVLDTPIWMCAQPSLNPRALCVQESARVRAQQQQHWASCSWQINVKAPFGMGPGWR